MAVRSSVMRTSLVVLSPTPVAQRRGVTLLEVLISMAVIAIGLLGVAAMFPVGASKVQQAIRHDRASALGQAAFHEIKIRGLLNPGNWVVPDTSDTDPLLTTSVLTGGGINPDLLLPATGSTLPGIPLAPASSFSGFAYDPLTYAGSSHALQQGLFAFSTPSTNPPAGVPWLLRVTSANASGNLPGRPLANAVMTAHDDLTFDRPDDRDRPAFQINKTDSGTGTNIHRQYDGAFSWMFTAVPLLDSNSNLTGRYNVSVVIFHRRLLVDTLPLTAEVSERMVPIVGSLGGGIGGLEANLSSGTKAYLERIKSGNWVMLSGMKNSLPVIKWYRVTSIEDEILGAGAGPFTRWISLAGPDLDTTNTTNVRISLFDDAIAVYERTMRVEGSSMYK